jgi:formate C-acetyltransferase
VGVQQGDNGQSMVLGGYDLDGNDQFNELSAICMDASLELEVIDPKINLRVSKKTADERYEYGTRLTKKGLGFPQYCNDDIVVPGLIALGYAPEDAVNYTVAACWEFIVPNCAMDIPNIQTFNFPLVINNAVHAGLEAAADFDALMQTVDQAIDAECARIIESCNTRETYARGRCIRKSPLFSLLTDGCLESGRDVSEFGAKYYNLGCHGAGIANAADALAAIKQVIYEDGSVTKAELLAALDKNFEGEAKLRNRLLSCPKVGNDDDRADSLMLHIMERFSASLNGKPTGSGGVWRAGTGSAMEYILSAQNCPATADGRLASAPYGSSFSPAVTTKLQGPLSTVRSFTKPDLTKTINGGPLTLEIHDNVFRNEIGERKVAQLVKLFVHLGGHQLQLNAINRETLLEAQRNPEKHRNLIVRVWGWSGYFCELEQPYQDHVIRRTEFTV